MTYTIFMDICQQEEHLKHLQVTAHQHILRIKRYLFSAEETLLQVEDTLHIHSDKTLDHGNL